MIAAAVAATLALWHGPGERACNGRCPMEWALAQLTETQRAAVVEAMAAEPRPMLVRDGDYLPLMTYYASGPRAQHGAVAALDAPEPATGWCVRGGCFVQIERCQNWAFVSQSIGGGSLLPPWLPPAGGRSAEWTPALFVGRSGGHRVPVTGAAVIATSSRAVAPTDPALFPAASSTRLSRDGEAGAVGAATERASASWDKGELAAPPTIPLPPSLLLLLSALAGLLSMRRKANG